MNSKKNNSACSYFFTIHIKTTQNDAMYVIARKGFCPDVAICVYIAKNKYEIATLTLAMTLSQIFAIPLAMKNKVSF